VSFNIDFVIAWGKGMKILDLLKIGLGRGRDRNQQEDEGVVGRAVQAIVSPWERGRSINMESNVAAQLQAFTGWVYVCATKNAQAVASVPLRLFVAKAFKGQKTLVKTRTLKANETARLRNNSSTVKWVTKAEEIDEVMDHPFLQLMQNVNCTMNRFDLWELTELYLELTGNAYWYMVRDELTKLPAEIWVLNSRNMRVVAGEKDLVGGYVYHVGGVSRVPFDPDEIVHFKFPNPKNMYYGYSPLMAVAEAVVLYKDISEFERTLIENNARPEAVLTTDQQLTKEQYKMLKDQFEESYGGKTRKGKTILLQKGLTYNPITMLPKDIAYAMGRKMSREEIMAAYGVPMSKVTSENVNLANANVGEQQYMRDTITPRLRRIEEKINEKIMPIYDENLFVAYDDILPVDRDFQLKVRESNLRNYVITVNEVRREEGLDEVAWGNSPLAPMNVGALQLESEPKEGKAVAAADDDDDDDRTVPQLPESSSNDPTDMFMQCQQLAMEVYRQLRCSVHRTQADNNNSEQAS